MFKLYSFSSKFAIVLAICLFTTLNYSLSQFPQTITLSARNPSVVQSNSTEVGKQYIVTIEGTYSMWQTYDSHGVDAAYLYDVPQEEIDNLRWPPKKVLGQTLYELPLWFGTNKEIPPFEIPGLNMKFVSRDHIGLRINGNWLPDLGYQAASHTYQIRMIGTGNPFNFQILDSSFNISQMRTVTMHEDNSGELIVRIEEEPELNICEFSVICEDNEVVGIRLSAALFQYTDSTNTPKNLLNEINHEMLGMTIDGLFICPDSIRCNESVEGNMAWAMVFDASGSMEDEYGTITKIEALRNSASNFLDKLRANDEGLLIHFNQTVRLSQDWTTDIELLKQKVNDIEFKGNTAYFDAGYEGVERTYVHKNPNKAIVLLSDGEDNSSTHTEDELIDFANEKNINIFTIGVSLTEEGQTSLKRISDLTGGKYYSANDPEAMDSVFTDIYNEIETDDCCRIYFSIPDSIMNAPKPYKTQIHLLTYDKEGNLIVKTINIIIPENCDDILSSIIWEFDENYDFERTLGISSKIMPNPSNSISELVIESTYPRHISIELLNANGKLMQSVNDSYLNEGTHSFSIDCTNYASGVYIVKITLDGQSQITKKLIIAK